MNNIITYFYLEPKDQSSICGVNEKDYTKKNEYYFRCNVDLFYSSLHFNKNCRHYFIINDASNLDFINNFDFKKFCSEKGIEIIEQKSKYVRQQKAWAGCMYLFDAIEYFKENNLVNDDDNYIFLDNDILFNGSIENIVNKDFDYMCYNIIHEFQCENNFNGLDISNNKEISNCYGGEFFALKGKNISTILNIFKDIYMKYDYFTEEHYLSHILSGEKKKGKAVVEVNDSLKRCWTTFKYFNGKKEDRALTILHLPSEKEYGLYCCSKRFIKHDEYNRAAALRLCSVGKRNFFVCCRKLMKNISKKFKTLVKEKKKVRYFGIET